MNINQQGIGLVEVIVSLLLLAVATLGFIAMQGSAVKITSESSERTHSLVLMRDIGEKIRANPAGLDTYIEKINAGTVSKPSKDCGLYNVSKEACTPAELATAQVFALNEEVSNSDFDIKIVPCPSSGGNNKNSIMYSYCMISAWGDTTATVGSDDKIDDDNGTMDCLTEETGEGDEVQVGGSYQPGATCMLMELT